VEAKKKKEKRIDEALGLHFYCIEVSFVYFNR
jgi:hypothetical protein